MADNVIKKKPKKQDTRKGPSLFTRIERVIAGGTLFEDGVPVKYIPKVLFIVGLGLVYIANTHYGERLQRNYQKTKKEVQDLRFDYMTLKATYMLESKQSNVAKNVSEMGLIQPDKPPFKINLASE